MTFTAFKHHLFSSLSNDEHRNFTFGGIRHFLCRTFGKIINLISLQTLPNSLFIQNFFVLGDSAKIFEDFFLSVAQTLQLGQTEFLHLGCGVH